MKKAIVALALAAIASTASARIAAGSHDLSAATGGGTGVLSACQYCHAPHNVNTTISGTPLWNRNASGVVTWNMYTSNTLKGAIAAAPNANSMTCLSCHDGSTNMGDTYTGSKDLALGAMVAGGTYDFRVGLGGALTNDHPVSVRYSESANQFDSVTNVGNAGLVLYGAANAETVECGSCHDPHGDSDGAAGGLAFLRVARDTICTDCHLK